MCIMRNDRFMHDCEQVKVSPKALITVVATATLVRRWPPSNQRFRPRRFREQRSLSKYALRLSIAKQGRGSSQPGGVSHHVVVASLRPIREHDHLGPGGR